MTAYQTINIVFVLGLIAIAVAIAVPYTPKLTYDQRVTQCDEQAAMARETGVVDNDLRALQLRQFCVDQAVQDHYMK